MNDELAHARLDAAARAAYAAHCATDPCDDWKAPDWSDGGYSAEAFVWQAVARAVLRAADKGEADLRDQFAGQALTGLLSTGEDFQDADVDGWDWHAKASYSMADAMIRAREG